MENTLQPFENETLTSTRHEKATDWISDEDISLKYGVRIVTMESLHPLKRVVTMLEKGDYELQPEFRRRYQWNNRKKSLLIESFLINVPVPPVFLYEDRPSHYEVVDGFQRINAVYDLFRDKLVLEGLEKWPELNGRRYSQLPDQIKEGLIRRNLSSFTLLPSKAVRKGDEAQFRQMVFERMNTGGSRITHQESRSFIYKGRLNDLCRKLSRNKYLCRTWDIPEPDAGETDDVISDELLANEHYQRMEDVELVLRFLANREKELCQEESVKEYLDRFLKYGNEQFSEERLKDSEALFNETIRLVYEIFGEKAFWLPRYRNNEWIWWPEATIAVYDPLMYVISQHVSDVGRILQCDQKFRSGIEDFYKENYDMFREEDIHQVGKRIALFEKLITDIIRIKKMWKIRFNLFKKGYAMIFRELG
ncbi:DUF262 domain-containing protein [Desulfobacterales bacterium HSG2]|nr:DUF262 domain-containing protein [Desulfobacterales bacterium HSG2]